MIPSETAANAAFPTRRLGLGLVSAQIVFFLAWWPSSMTATRQVRRWMLQRRPTPRPRLRSTVPRRGVPAPPGYAGDAGHALDVAVRARGGCCRPRATVGGCRLWPCVACVACGLSLALWTSVISDRLIGERVSCWNCCWSPILSPVQQPASAYLAAWLLSNGSLALCLQRRACSLAR